MKTYRGMLSDAEHLKAFQKVEALIEQQKLEAQLQLLRDIKNSEGYGKMPIGMRDLLSDFSQTINELKQKGE